MGRYCRFALWILVIVIDDDGDIVVKWDSGTKGDGEWYCGIADVEEVEETN